MARNICFVQTIPTYFVQNEHQREQKPYWNTLLKHQDTSMASKDSTRL